MLRCPRTFGWTIGVGAVVVGLAVGELPSEGLGLQPRSGEGAAAVGPVGKHPDVPEGGEGELGPPLSHDPAPLGAAGEVAEGVDAELSGEEPVPGGGGASLLEVPQNADPGVEGAAALAGEDAREGGGVEGRGDAVGDDDQAQVSA